MSRDPPCDDDTNLDNLGSFWPHGQAPPTPLSPLSDDFDLVSLDILFDDDPTLGSFWPLCKHRRLLSTYRVMSDSSQPKSDVS